MELFASVAALLPRASEREAKGTQRKWSFGCQGHFFGAQFQCASWKQIVDPAMPQVALKILEEINDTPQERISDRTFEHSDDLPVPRVGKEFFVVIKDTLQEPLSERKHEHVVDMPVPKVAPQVRISERIHEQIVDVPVQQILGRGRRGHRRARSPISGGHC